MDKAAWHLVRKRRVSRSPPKWVLIAIAIATSSFVRAAATSLPFPATLIAQFDASSITGVSSGSPISSWTDSIGGISATETNSAHYPTYLSNRINGLPGVKFGGNADLCMPLTNPIQAAIDGARSIFGSGYTIFITFKTLGPVTRGTIIGASAGFARGFHVYADGSNVGEHTLFANIPYSGQTSFSTVALETFSTGTHSSGGNKNLSLIYVNGGAVASTTTPNQTTDGHQICIGGQSLKIYGNVEVYDIVAWASPLTPPQLKQVEQWAVRRYGLPAPWAGSSAYNVFFGDSITEGVGATGGIVNQPCCLTARLLGLQLGQWDCLGIGGISTSSMSLLAPSWVDPMPAMLNMKVNLVGFEWFNQGGAPAIRFDKALSFLRARKMVANLRTVWGTSTSYKGDPDANRASYDNAFDSNTANIQSYIDSYMRLHDNAEIGRIEPPSSWSTYCPTCTPAYFSDGIHPNSAGYGDLAKIYAAGIKALPQR